MKSKILTLQDVSDCLARLREQSPLVHSITNFVVMEVTANALLAVGASPVMAHEPAEMEEITGMASALVLNIGTLSESWIWAMHKALEVAVARGLPVIIDPVGAGASHLRTSTALKLLERGRNVLLRGNASEIMALADGNARTRGVDSTENSRAAVEAAGHLARFFDCAASVSGETDFVTDGCRYYSISGGCSLMPRVTGMGCSASALVGAFAGVCNTGDRILPLVAAMAVMSAAGTEAAGKAGGPGSFLPAFLDSLYAMDLAMLERGVEIGVFEGGQGG